MRKRREGRRVRLSSRTVSDLERVLGDRGDQMNGWTTYEDLAALLSRDVERLCRAPSIQTDHFYCISFPRFAIQVGDCTLSPPPRSRSFG
jgi:hypothetical protein